MGSPFQIIFTLFSLILTIIAIIINKKFTKNNQKEMETLSKELVEKLYKLRKEQTKDTDEENESYISIISNNYYSKEEPTEKEIELAVHLSLMSNHQKSALMHSRVQFYVGIIMSIIGFIFFIFVISFSINSSNNLGMGIKITGSLIFEGISLLFLKESHKLRESSKEYHDNLYEINKQQLAVKIANSIENKEIQAAVMAHLSLHLMGVVSNSNDITKIIESQKKQATI